MVDVGERIRGCLAVGAVGDALGAVVEFDALDEIRGRFGSLGVTEPGMGARFTDDTQMTLFTVEGLIRASVRGRCRGVCHPPAVVWRAYQRWLWTQGVAWEEVVGSDVEFFPEPTGWLAYDRRLHRREAPGATCLAAVGGRRMGTRGEPVNDSKGCGGVMRAAPAGFLADRLGLDGVYELGCDLAALTHGHPGGWQPAGVLAAMVASLLDGSTVVEAARCALALTSLALRSRLEVAVSLAEAGVVCPETIEAELGAGWVGDEALAVAVACAAGFDDPLEALRASVNHSGDSDSTGSICGQLLGAAHGPEAVPEAWLARVDAMALVEIVAADVVLELTDPPRRAPRVPADLPDGVDMDYVDEELPAWWWWRYPGC